MLAADVRSILKRIGRKRRSGGGRAVVVGDEVAEADYTSLGHQNGL